jgi:hypothetical protein
MTEGRIIKHRMTIKVEKTGGRMPEGRKKITGKGRKVENV